MIFLELFGDNVYDNILLLFLLVKNHRDNKNKCEHETKLSKNYDKIVVQISFLFRKDYYYKTNNKKGTKIDIENKDI